MSDVTKVRISQTILYYVWVNETFEVEIPEKFTMDDLYHDHDMRENLKDKYWNEIEKASDAQVDSYADLMNVPCINQVDYMEKHDEEWEVLS